MTSATPCGRWPLGHCRSLCLPKTGKHPWRGNPWAHPLLSVQLGCSLAPHPCSCSFWCLGGGVSLGSQGRSLEKHVPGTSCHYRHLMSEPLSDQARCLLPVVASRFLSGSWDGSISLGFGWVVFHGGCRSWSEGKEPARLLWRCGIWMTCLCRGWSSSLQ